MSFFMTELALCGAFDFEPGSDRWCSARFTSLLESENISFFSETLSCSFQPLSFPFFFRRIRARITFTNYNFSFEFRKQQQRFKSEPLPARSPSPGSSSSLLDADADGERGSERERERDNAMDVDREMSPNSRRKSSVGGGADGAQLMNTKEREREREAMVALPLTPLSAGDPSRTTLHHHESEGHQRGWDNQETRGLREENRNQERGGLQERGGGGRGLEVSFRNFLHHIISFGFFFSTCYFWHLSSGWVSLVPRPSFLGFVLNPNPTDRRTDRWASYHASVFCFSSSQSSVWVELPDLTRLLVWVVRCPSALCVLWVFARVSVRSKSQAW